MKKIYSFLLFLSVLPVFATSNPNVILPEGIYPYWPVYYFIDDPYVSTIKPQEWINTNHSVEGWDWSLPGFVLPSQRSSLAFQRVFGWDTNINNYNLQFPINSTALLWVNWRDIELTPGNYNFSGIINRLKQAQSVGVKVSLRILCYSKSRGTKTGEAPLWLETLGATFLTQASPGDNLNYDPANPIFHQRYLLLLSELAKTEIPQLVRNMYVGYASPTYGDEGIGPYADSEFARNDTVKHVRENLDAIAIAFQGMESKVYMGGESAYGFSKGFGVRRGFVEMYYYRIPEQNMGQYIDSKGYLNVDENAAIINAKCIHGEVNEEYESAWATDSRSFRYGNSTVPFPYRYFVSNLRALQMQCTFVYTTGHLVPQMLPFIALELGRTVNDTPDVWSYLTTAYLKSTYYKNNDWQTPARTITTAEKNGGIDTRNFERWLYQRDAPGFETKPSVKIQHAIIMSTIQTDKYYDYIARSGKKIGFNIDSRWPGLNNEIAIKVSYLDQKSGSMNLLYHDGTNQLIKTQDLVGDNKLKTITFILPKISQKKLPNAFDFSLESGTIDSITVSMVRVISTNEIPNALTAPNAEIPINISFSSVDKSISITSKTDLQSLIVYDLTGKPVKQVYRPSAIYYLPIIDLQKGVYIIQVTDVRGYSVRRKLSLL